MITIEDTIKRIGQYGSIIVTTMLSFVVEPPAIYNESSATIHYNNFYVFIIGIICVLLYSKVDISNSKILKVFLLLSVFIILIIGYGFFQNRYTRLCKTDLDKEERFVISYSENFKSKQIKFIYDDWKNNDSDRTDLAIIEILRAKECNPSNIWKDSIIYPIFIAFFIYYLLIAITLILLINVISNKLINIKTSS